MPDVREMVKEAGGGLEADALFWTAKNELTLVRHRCEGTDLNGTSQAQRWLDGLDKLFRDISIRAMGTYWSEKYGRTTTVTFRVDGAR